MKVFFFNNFTIPKLDPKMASESDKPFTLAEVKSAILSVQTGKCHDLMVFHQNSIFSDKLSPLLLNMFKEAYEFGVLPLTV